MRNFHAESLDQNERGWKKGKIDRNFYFDEYRWTYTKGEIDIDIEI